MSEEKNHKAPSYEVKLEHALLEVEALGESAFALVNHLSNEVSDAGYDPQKLPTLGHLIMLAPLIAERARDATEGGCNG